MLHHNLRLAVALIATFPLCALAQTSTFDAEADGTPQSVPVLVADDLQEPEGRAEITVTPDQTMIGSQHFLRSERWGFWIYQNRLHMQFYTADGQRKLARVEDENDTPWPGAEVVASQPLSFEVNWSPAGVGVFVAGELRLYLEGDFLEPDQPVYGAAPDGESAFNGALSVSVFNEPRAFDPCTNHPDWARVQTFDSSGNSLRNEVPPEPTCQTVPDPEPEVVVNGVATSDLAWSRPTENEDGSVLLQAEIAGYSIFFGDASRVGRCGDRPAAADDDACYPNAMSIGGGLESQQVTFSVERDSVVYFAMATVAQNEEGEELLSRYSGEIARQFNVSIEDRPDSAPGAPTNISVTISAECETDDPNVTCDIEVIDVQ